MEKIYLLCILFFFAFGLSGQTVGITANENPQTYRNPVVNLSLPDPTVMRADDGYFYLYATADIALTPIFRSRNLVDWEQAGACFTPETRPSWEPRAGIWAPDINYINGKYVLYYSHSVWGCNGTCGIGVAVADSPLGPFTDKGALFQSTAIGVNNSIDQFYFEDNGKKYLIWGSFCGIYCIELEDDGLAIKAGAEKVRIAGKDTQVFDSQGTEGSYIIKRGKYYYYFGSTGTCCEGASSTYTVVVGRSESLFGPYLDKKGQSMFDNHYEVVLHGNSVFAGPGHNAEIITDDNGDDWLLYHAYMKSDPQNGRVLCMDKLIWTDGWPTVEGLEPSAESPAPVFRNQPEETAHIPLADPFILYYADKYYAYGTSDRNGIVVYTSDDLKSWTKEPALALHKDNSYGDRNFWAPEVYHVNGKFYMYYSAEEHICVATGDSPLGPFKQDVQKPMMEEKGIDNSLFIDDDGKAYLFFVRFTDGNAIWVAELENDLKTLKLETLHPCIHVTDDWESVMARVTEGPFVIKHKGVYYMTYSANHYQSQDYAVGYATTRNIMGEWKKYEGNPILRRPGNLVGTGHHGLFTDRNGQLMMAFHAHKSASRVAPREMYIAAVRFVSKRDGSDDILRVSPYYITPQTAVSHNPLPVAFGDPFILKASDDQYYMYGTSDGVNGFKAYSSHDLKEWKYEGVVYQGATPASWTVDCFWAPEVYERDGKYYMWYSANWKENPDNEEENFRIGVAVADKPTGPFKEMFDRPVFDPGYPIIDANLFFDDDNGKVYLYYSRCCYKHPVKSEVADWAKKQGWYNEIEESWVYGVELKPDFSGVIGEPQLLLQPPLTMDDPQAEWESRSVTSHEVNRRWTEGSFLLKHNGLYYIMYSANFFGGKNYAVGYAVSDSPLGPFRKADNNPVLQKNTEQNGNVTGTGHCMALNINGQLYCVYHGRTTETGNKRVVFIDKMDFTPDGKLLVYGPTTAK
jgi:beta-xylosidase